MQFRGAWKLPFWNFCLSSVVPKPQAPSPKPSASVVLPPLSPRLGFPAGAILAVLRPDINRIQLPFLSQASIFHVHRREVVLEHADGLQETDGGDLLDGLPAVVLLQRGDDVALEPLHDIR